MQKRPLHIFLTLLFLLSFTGVSSAETVCKMAYAAEYPEEQTCEDCCSLKKEYRRLESDIASGRSSVASPGNHYLPASFIQSMEYNVAVQELLHSEKLYIIPTLTRDLMIHNQVFRI